MTIEGGSVSGVAMVEAEAALTAGLSILEAASAHARKSSVHCSMAAVLSFIAGSPTSYPQV